MSDTASGIATWQIDRFDFIFYNGRHKRWQYFSEDPQVEPSPDHLSQESLHRRQIRNLLTTFREAIRVVTEEVGRHQGPSRCIRVATKSSTRLPTIALPRPKFPGWGRNDWSAYLKYLIEAARYEGIPTAHLKDLVELAKSSTGDSAPDELSISRDAALTFLSLLPILEDWDTWGCFLRTLSLGSCIEEQQFPPPEAKNWVDPFYMVELDFRESSRPGSVSRKILNATVQLEGLCMDLAEGTPEPRVVPKADFFDPGYCKCPTGKELYTYQCYASLIDPILNGLAASPSVDAPTGSDKRHYIIAYPISASGRLHFLQLAVTARTSIGDVSIRALWEAWKPFHRALWATETRRFLHEEVHRIMISAFQMAAFVSLSEEFGKRNNVDERMARATLLQHLYHLVPTENAFDDHQSFCYVPSFWPSPPPRDRLSVGWSWQVGNATPQSRQQDCLAVKAAGLAVMISTQKRNSLQKLALYHRTSQILVQQMEYLNYLRMGLAELSRRKNEDARKCAAAVFAQVRQLEFDVQRQILAATRALPEEVLDAEIDSALRPREEEMAEPFAYAGNPHSLRRYLGQAYGGTELDLLARVKHMVRPSLLLRLSEYFETGPVKILTHRIMSPGKCFAGSRQEIKLTVRQGGSLFELFRLISKDIDDLALKITKVDSDSSRDLTRAANWLRRSRLGEPKERLITTLADFHRVVCESLETTNQWPPRAKVLDEPREQFVVRRFALGDWAIDLGRGEWGDNRFFGVCPGCLLSTFWLRYLQDKGRGERERWQAECISTRLHKLARRDDLPYQSEYHGASQNPVAIIQHYLFLPYHIAAIDPWLRGGELVSDWKERGSFIGQLYYCDGHKPAQLVDVCTDSLAARLVPDHVMGALLSAQLPETEREKSYLAIVLEHWKMKEESNA